jgi:hypothetical protein
MSQPISLVPVLRSMTGSCGVEYLKQRREGATSPALIELPYNHHLIDIEALVMGALGHDAPCSLKDLRIALGLEGENPAPHTALSDAREVKIIFDALRARRKTSVA